MPTRPRSTVRDRKPLHNRPFVKIISKRTLKENSIHKGAQIVTGQDGFRRVDEQGALQVQVQEARDDDHRRRSISISISRGQQAQVPQALRDRGPAPGSVPRRAAGPRGRARVQGRREAQARRGPRGGEGRAGGEAAQAGRGVEEAAGGQGVGGGAGPAEAARAQGEEEGGGEGGDRRRGRHTRGGAQAEAQGHWGTRRLFRGRARRQGQEVQEADDGHDRRPDTDHAGIGGGEGHEGGREGAQGQGGEKVAVPPAGELLHHGARSVRTGHGGGEERYDCQQTSLRDHGADPREYEAALPKIRGRGLGGLPSGTHYRDRAGITRASLCRCQRWLPAPLHWQSRLAHRCHHGRYPREKCARKAA